MKPCWLSSSSVPLSSSAKAFESSLKAANYLIDCLIIDRCQSAIRNSYFSNIFPILIWTQFGLFSGEAANYLIDWLNDWFSIDCISEFRNSDFSNIFPILIWTQFGLFQGEAANYLIDWLIIDRLQSEIRNSYFSNIFPILIWTQFGLFLGKAANYLIDCLIIDRLQSEIRNSYFSNIFPILIRTQFGLFLGEAANYLIDWLIIDRLQSEIRNSYFSNIFPILIRTQFGLFLGEAANYLIGWLIIDRLQSEIRIPEFANLFHILQFRRFHSWLRPFRMGFFGDCINLSASRNLQIYISRKNFLDKKQSYAHWLYSTKISANFINSAHTYAPGRFTLCTHQTNLKSQSETISQHCHSFNSVLGVKSRYWPNFRFVPYLQLKLFTKIISSKTSCKITISARFTLNRSHLSHSHRNF